MAEDRWKPPVAQVRQWVPPGADIAALWLWTSSPGGGEVVVMAVAIVLFGAAIGIARGLEVGLEYRVRHWLGMPETG